MMIYQYFNIGKKGHSMVVFSATISNHNTNGGKIQMGPLHNNRSSQHLKWERQYGNTEGNRNTQSIDKNKIELNTYKTSQSQVQMGTPCQEVLSIQTSREALRQRHPRRTKLKVARVDRWWHLPNTITRSRSESGSSHTRGGDPKSSSTSPKHLSSIQLPWAGEVGRLSRGRHHRRSINRSRQPGKSRSWQGLRSRTRWGRGSRTTNTHWRGSRRCYTI